jgi:uncharacterized membrane protein
MKAIAAALLLSAALAPSALAQPADSLAARGPALGDSARVAAAPYRMPPIGKALFDHMHNKLIHFPIVLTLVAAALLVVSRKRPELEPVAFWLVWIAALSVIPAYFSGKVQAEHLKGRPKEWLAAVHEKQGIAIGVSQAIWVLSLLKANTRRFAWVIGLVLAVLVLSAGFLGGLLAHGR